MSEKLEYELGDIIFDPFEGVELLLNDDIISFDLETTGLSPWRDNIALMQFYGNKTQTPVLIRISDGVVPDVVKSLFATGGKLFVGHNVVGFDVLFLDTHGVDWSKNKWYDTLIGEGVISTTSRRDVSRNLKSSIRRRLGMTIDKNIEHGKWMADQLSDQQLTYAVNDVIYIQELMREQIEKAGSQEQTEALDMEMELAPIVAKMTLNGLPLLPEYLNMWLDEQKEVEKRSREWLIEHLGPINLNSPVQLMRRFKELDLNFENTRADTLTAIASFGEGLASDIASHLLEYRAPAQRMKMYQESWQKQHIIDDWVHARFWQVGTDTMRFSSSNPNLQQVPKDGRKIIGNLDGVSIVNADYSQIEVRIAAQIANDERLIEVLNSGDVHKGVAAQIFDITEEEVTPAQRKLAKAATFTLLFGGGPQMLFEYAKNSGSHIEFNEAREIFSRFFVAFQGLREMRNKAYAMSKDRKVVSIRLPNSGKRVLIGKNVTPTRILNTVVQGSAAVGLKYAILEADKMGLTKYLGATVHDELVAAVPDKEVEAYSKALEQAMIIGMRRAFPNMEVLVEVKSGKYWQI